MEATDDGILVEGVSRSVISINKNFYDFFAIDPSEGKDIETLDLLKAGIPIIQNTDGIGPLVISLQPTSNNRNLAIIELKNGSVLELDSLPLIHENAVKGRVWYFKDITEKYNLTHKLSFEATHDPLTKLTNRRSSKTQCYTRPTVSGFRSV